VGIAGDDRCGVAGEYPGDDWTAIITTCGRICYQRRKINVSQVFAGQKVGVKQVDERDETFGANRRTLSEEVFQLAGSPTCISRRRAGYSRRFSRTSLCRAPHTSTTSLCRGADTRGNPRLVSMLAPSGFPCPAKRYTTQARARRIASPVTTPTGRHPPLAARSGRRSGRPSTASSWRVGLAAEPSGWSTRSARDLGASAYQARRSRTQVYRALSSRRRFCALGRYSLVW